MRLLYRRLYFIMAVLVFLAAASAVLLYTAGWRYQPDSGSLGQVGAIYVDTEPDDARLTINGKPVKSETPTAINNLQSGRYRLSISKDGYFEWQADAVVTSAKLTRLTDVWLLPQPRQRQPLVFTAEPPVTLRVSPPGTQLAAIRENTIEVWSTELSKRQTSITFTSPVTHVSWSPSGERLLVHTTDGAWFVGAANAVTMTLLPAVTDARWASEGDLAYAATATGWNRAAHPAWRMEPIAIPGTLLLATDTYYFYRDEGTLFVRRHNPTDTPLAIRPLSDAPVNITPGPEGFFSIHDEAAGEVYIHHPRLGITERIASNISSLQWHLPTKTLLLQNHHELFTWSIDGSSPRLVTRTSETITASQWLLANHYLAYQTEAGNLYALETQRVMANRYPLPSDLGTLHPTTNTAQLLLAKPDQASLLDFQP